ncbi:MAG TPA: metallophosphoesterase, partial [Acidimicrobiia bacterium]|nr:metallophosphoesterase [Acidimicrobiia bacterium]
MTNSQLKLLHCADLHLDAVLGDSVNASQLNLLSKEEQTKLRDAPLLALEKISELAISKKVNIVIIAGDIFNRRDGVSSDIRTRSAFTNFLRALSDNSIQIYIALGNHDPLGTISDLSAPWPDSVHLFSSRAPETHKIKIDGLDVAIHGVSYQNNEES